MAHHSCITSSESLGHKCPACGEPILPSSEDETPIAQILKNQLKGSAWVQPALSSTVSHSESVPSSAQVDSSGISIPVDLTPAEVGHGPEIKTPLVQSPSADSRSEVSIPNGSRDVVASSSTTVEPSILSQPSRTLRVLDGSEERSRKYKKLFRKGWIEISRRWRVWRRYFLARKGLVLAAFTGLALLFLIFAFYEGDDSSAGPVRKASEAEHRVLQAAESELHKLAGSERMYDIREKVRRTHERIREGSKALKQSNPNGPVGIF
eukprot:CAMPEP_0184683488 /NCGR_PEP_ID=MMETSP0312-20130426/11550_1 /TAXON_ID=31354 /ORGANISM="Compsopogon coeruleus, Strain SAG 36.94" /LENGTH=264 /DNA_ID=CAMNT_0027135893 /DNA_START=249 /DNA_END=1043 /DNA_ORIENTATION=+